eukprot:366469-Chlamydomonas_euryale.AAC.8
MHGRVSAPARQAGGRAQACCPVAVVSIRLSPHRMHSRTPSANQSATQPCKLEARFPYPAHTECRAGPLPLPCPHRVQGRIIPSSQTAPDPKPYTLNPKTLHCSAHVQTTNQSWPPLPRDFHS